MFPKIVTLAIEKVSHFIKGLDRLIKGQMFFILLEDFLVMVEASLEIEAYLGKEDQDTPKYKAPIQPM